VAAIRSLLLFDLRPRAAASGPLAVIINLPRRPRRFGGPDPVGGTSCPTPAALLALRDQIIGPILAGVRGPRMGRQPAHWTPVDRQYEDLRIRMQALFNDLGITVDSATVA
jgi:hypothetical protein